MAKTLGSQCRGPRFNPRWEKEIPRATAKNQHSQINKQKKIFKPVLRKKPTSGTSYRLNKGDTFPGIQQASTPLVSHRAKGNFKILWTGVS